MNKVMKLTKIFLKNSFSEMNTKMGVGTKSKFKILAYVFLFLYFAAIIIGLSYNLLQGLIEINQASVFVGMILFMIFGLAIMQTIFSSINILYFTKDNEYILPLPLKPYQIILARTIVMLIGEYIFISLIGVIPLGLYGILTGAGVLYYILMILAIILLPILPVLVISMITMIIMSFAKLTKNRNRFQLIASLVLLAIIIALSLSLSGVKEDISNAELAQMIVEANGMLGILKGYIPTIDYLTNALITDSALVAFIEIFKTIGITAIGFIIYMLIAQKVYFKGLIGNLFGGGAKKNNKEVNQKRYNNSKLYKSYVGKEFKGLIRNPVFFMQCLLPAILIPVLMTAVIFAGFSGNSTEMEEISKELGTLQTNSFMMICVVLGIIQFFTMFIYISITAISRDGDNAVFIKYVPVSLYKQYIYKITPNIIMNVITSLITLGIAEYILHLPIITLIGILLVSTIIGILQSILMIIIDLKRPKLKWDSEYAVAKQNFNLIFPMLFSMVVIGILVGAVLLLQNINAYIGLTILGILFTIITISMNRYLFIKQNELAEKIM